MPNGNQGYNRSSFGLIDEALYNSNANAIVSRYSNLGTNNPNKGPTARSLFYEAGKRYPGKYGQFLLYSLGNFSNDFINAYYRSESSEYNSSISSVESKNPTAGFLVRQTGQNEQILLQNRGILSGVVSANAYNGAIVGGLAAPYYWKDFLYCKYYGAIPNNYMITLRRFPHPILDNFSIPDAVKNGSAFSEEGSGRPVAQAVTWFGGNTGNSLNSLIQFSTGISWKDASQDTNKTQEAFSKGLWFDGPANLVGKVTDALGTKGLTDVAKSFIDGAIAASDPSQTITNAIRVKGLRDRAKEQGGLMSEYIWVPVDVVKGGQVRDVGLPFTWGEFKVTFEYDLTSVGEVNSKAALLDIMGNLLSIGTNYGNFLTPDIRYNSNFPVVGFPGGNKGLELYYKDPISWFVKYGKEIASIANPGGSNENGEGGEETGPSKLEEIKSQLKSILQASSGSSAKLQELVESLGKSLGAAGSRLIKLALTSEFLETYQAPISLLTGAPIGEWHLTIGNPCNPIAMIGNLICKGVNINFSDALGPDDFPTSIKAEFTLSHARDRERGEIESIFNRGDGRLYQSSNPTSASVQSYTAYADVSGNMMNEQTVENYFNGTVWQREGLFPENLGQ
jgi:hypothetical protein